MLETIILRLLAAPHLSAGQYRDIHVALDGLPVGRPSGVDPICDAVGDRPGLLNGMEIAPAGELSVGAIAESNSSGVDDRRGKKPVIVAPAQEGGEVEPGRIRR